MRARNFNVAGLGAVTAAMLAAGGMPVEAPAGEGANLHARIEKAYMAGDWDDLDAALRAAPKALGDLTDEQKADVAYVRTTLAQCRPAWWAACKAGKKTRIRQELLNARVMGYYAPGTGGVKVTSGRLGPVLTLEWDPQVMDSTEKGLYGYQKGDQTCLTTWGSLSTGEVLYRLLRARVSTDDEARKMRINRYLAFRSNLNSVYFSTPPGRRYGLHIYMAGFMDQWYPGPTTGCRRAVCAMFLGEVLTKSDKYPSLPLPRNLPADQTEKALGTHYKFQLKRSALWTIGEDRAFREALKAFATANDKTVFNTEIVKLPNGLEFHLDPDKDNASYREKRDAWIKEKFDAL